MGVASVTGIRETSITLFCPWAITVTRLGDNEEDIISFCLPGAALAGAQLM